VWAALRSHAVHLGAMVFGGRLIASENIIHQDSMEGALNRLTRTFTTQMECLKRYRASGPRGAKTRPGRACNSPAVRGKRRCRMHGGAPGSGAPRGNKNALKFGLYTREALAERKRLRNLLRQSRKLIMRFVSQRESS
jgi:hypothetical protein